MGRVMVWAALDFPQIGKEGPGAARGDKRGQSNGFAASLSGVGRVYSTIEGCPRSALDFPQIGFGGRVDRG